MLRFARALGRAGFLFMDTCADPDRSPWRYEPSQWGGNDTDCGFDGGAFVRGFGGLDWQWSTESRKLVEACHFHSRFIRFHGSWQPLPHSFLTA